MKKDDHKEHKMIPNSTGESGPHNTSLDPSHPSSPIQTNISNIQKEKGRQYSQNSSSVAWDPVDTQEHNVRARERVEVLRGRVIRSRRKIHDLKEDARQLRERQWKASSKFMEAVNKIMALGDVQNLESLQPLYKKASDAQDDLGPVEEEYDRMESRLSYEEQELEREEKIFYTYNDIRLRELSDEELDKSLSSVVKPYEHPKDENVVLDDETLEAFFKQLAKALDLKEALDDMETGYHKIIQARLVRKRHNFMVSQESRNFLTNYVNIFTTTLKELHETEDHLHILRDRCLDEDLFGEDEYVYTRRDALVEEIMESVNEALERSPLRAAAKQDLTQPNFQDKRDSVNAWLLESLIDSMLDANRLKSWIFSEFGQRENERNEFAEDWADLAIRFWDNDTAGAKVNEYDMLSQMDAIAGE